MGHGTNRICRNVMGNVSDIVKLPNSKVVKLRKITA